MDSALATAAATAAATAIEAGGYRAILRRAGVVLAYPSASVRELGQARVQAQYGRDDVRVADADLAASTPRPAKDDTLELLEGPQLGTWTVLGVERADAAVVSIRIRQSTRVSASAPGVHLDR
jgi:hypothetical protein